MRSNWALTVREGGNREEQQIHIINIDNRKDDNNNYNTFN